MNGLEAEATVAAERARGRTVAADRAGRRTLQRERPRLTGRAAALLVAVSVLTVLALVPARQFLDQRARIADLERRAALLEARNAALRAEVTRLHDPVELERLARECLGMVAPGETALIVPGVDPDRSDC